MSDLSEQIKRGFPQRKIVIVGDLVADQFLRGTIARVSREAPVFILSHDETETIPGSAANAAVNVATLGGKSVLIGLVGKDENGKVLLEKLTEANVDCGSVVESENLKTTTKLRVLAGQHYAARQQVIRIDYENKNPIDEKLQNQLKENFLAAANDADAVIISDYNYGVANKNLTAAIVEVTRQKNIPLLVDSRFHLEEFLHATSATPNQDEIEQILGKNFSDEDCVKLCERMNYESLLITRGNQGMLLIEKGKSPLSLEAVGAKEPVDVTLANHAGGIVVMKKGTASVTVDELLDSLEKFSAQ
jgi:rfaE bifunctional protein kinase chain/domain